MESLTADLTKMGEAIVSPDFSIKEDNHIFCIGDCAFLKDVNGVEVPAVAQGALQAGEFVAKQIINDQKGKKREGFKYFDKGSMATIGRSKAVADVAGLKFSGFIAWFLWCVIHILFLVNFRNKLLVFFDWVTSYFTHKRSVRLINTYRAKKDIN